MRAQHPEEAAMLLSAYQQAAQRDADRMRQRRRAARTLFGVAGAAALLVGCIAAVDVFALNGGAGDNTMTLQVRTGAQDVDDEAIAMESQFGWNSIGYGWCSLKSSTWCMFSKDKEACKEGINCYKNREKASADDGDADEGSGSGDFNATVGDDVEVGEDDDVEVGEDDDEETPSAAAPATPADNPTEPLDLGGGDEEDEDGDEAAPADDGDEDEETTEDDDDEAPADDEEAPADDEEAPADDEEDAPADDEVAGDDEAPAGDEEEETGDGETVTEDKDQDDNMGGED